MCIQGDERRDENGEGNQGCHDVEYRFVILVWPDQQFGNDEQDSGHCEKIGDHAYADAGSREKSHHIGFRSCQPVDLVDLVVGLEGNLKI